MRARRGQLWLGDQASSATSSVVILNGEVSADCYTGRRRGGAASRGVDSSRVLQGVEKAAAREPARLCHATPRAARGELATAQHS